jgi:[NiFe] hydrogenase small subunit
MGRIYWVMEDNSIHSKGVYMSRLPEQLIAKLEQRGVSRRNFMKFCGVTAAALGMGPTMAGEVAHALAKPKKPPVVWLHFAECTGCSESFLRTVYPTVADVVLDVVSLDYHETLMAAAGHQAEEALHHAVKEHEGKFLCICEGGVPTKHGGVYGKVAGKPMLEIAKEVVPKALATVAIGQCACYGGIQAAAPNPTEAKSVSQATGVKTVNLAGCPPNPVNTIATIVHYLLMGQLPQLDEFGRPVFAYGLTIHDFCHRRAHYEDGNYAEAFGDEGHRQGWCLEKLGCKGPFTFNNCSRFQFNNGTNWPIGAGHPCIGCSEPQFWDEMSPFFEEKL